MNKLQYLQFLGKLGNQGGKKPTWTPARLSNLSLWLDAADASTITLNGSTVSQWNDKSGQGNHVSNATAATQPDYLTTGWNGKPTVSFTRLGEDFLFKQNVANFSASGDFTIASVFEFLETSNNWDMIAGWRTAANSSGGGGGVPILQGMSTSQEIGYHNTDQVDTRIKVDVTTRLGKKLATISRSGGSNGLNGAATVTSTGYSQATYETNATQSFTSEAPSGFQIGGRQQGATSYGDKYISEVVGCNTKLSTEDRQKLEGYLAWKWGLVHNLPVNHPYRWDGREFGYTFSGITDTDAQTYIAGVETADGQVLENATRTAIQNFIVGAKADGIWDAIKSSVILAGARTLSGALVPLKGTAPTNYNFVAGDYNRKTGLVGDGSTKYLDSNRNNNADPQNNQHMSVYATTPNTGTLWYIGAGANETGSTHIYSFSGSALGARNRSDIFDNNVGTNSAGLIGISRDNSSSYVARGNSANNTISRASQTPLNSVVRVFLSSSATTAYANARIAFYSIGESLDLALLDTRVTQLMTDLGNAIP